MISIVVVLGYRVILFSVASRIRLKFFSVFLKALLSVLVLVC